MKRGRENNTGDEPNSKHKKTKSLFDTTRTESQNILGIIGFAKNYWDAQQPNSLSSQEIRDLQEDENIPLLLEKLQNKQQEKQQTAQLEENNHTPFMIDSSTAPLEIIIENPAIVRIENLPVTDDNRKNLLIKRLFKTQDENPDLYYRDNIRHEKFEKDMSKYNKIIASNKEAIMEKPKRVYPPIIQLSHDGLALMSYLYAQKDNSPKQPIVVRTFEDFENIVTFIDNSTSDIGLTLIFQCNEPFNDYYGKNIHHVALKLEKINSEVRVIFLDSIISSNTQVFCKIIIGETLKKNGEKFSRKPNKIHCYYEKFTGNIPRQYDRYQCTIFATKDARELNRDNELDFLKNSTLSSSNSNNAKCSYKYVLPPKYLKGVQSRSYQTVALDKFGEEIVTRKGNSLSAVFNKHPEQSYIPHFSKKYLRLVTEFATTHSDIELDNAINMYSAEKLTPEKLVSVYGNKNNKPAS